MSEAPKACFNIIEAKRAVRTVSGEKPDSVHLAYQIIGLCINKICEAGLAVS
jgi:hypothetical protein